MRALPLVRGPGGPWGTGAGRGVSILYHIRSSILYDPTPLRAASEAQMGVLSRAALEKSAACESVGLLPELPAIAAAAPITALAALSVLAAFATCPSCP